MLGLAEPAQRPAEHLVSDWKFLLLYNDNKRLKIDRKLCTSSLPLAEILFYHYLFYPTHL